MCRSTRPRAARATCCPTRCASCARSPTRSAALRRRAATARCRRRRSSTRQVLARGDAAAADPAYRLFDEQGNVLVLRSDMTIPIARLVGARYASAPSRRCASATSRTPTAPCARSAARRASCCRPASSWSARRRPRGRPRRSRCCCAALDAAGPGDYRIGLGDAGAVPGAARRGSGCRPARAGRSCTSSVTRDFVGLEREVEGLRLGARAPAAAARACRSCAAVPRCSRADGPAADGARARATPAGAPTSPGG